MLNNIVFSEKTLFYQIYFFADLRVGNLLTVGDLEKNSVGNSRRRIKLSRQI